jgi:hypothetical protein
MIEIRDHGCKIWTAFEHREDSEIPASGRRTYTGMMAPSTASSPRHGGRDSRVRSWDVDDL